MTTEPETIPADVLELAKEAHANFARSSVTDNLTTIIARAIMTDRTSRAPVGGAGWRPIKTAPKDGTRFLALEGNRHFDCWMACYPRDGCYWMDEADTEPDPTHWLPLPAAPAAPGTHPAPSSPDAEMVEAVKDVLAERERQKTVEGWTPEHDDTHKSGEMALAAACYALNTLHSSEAKVASDQLWPWSDEWWKPKDARHDLVRAGALIIAEIERRDRLSKHEGNQP